MNYNKKIVGGFIQGPLPITQIRYCNQMGPSFLKVYLLLVYKRSLTKSSTFKISSDDLKCLEIHRNSFYRGINALESLKLIGALKHRGRQTEITILPSEFWDGCYEK